MQRIIKWVENMTMPKNKISKKFNTVIINTKEIDNFFSEIKYKKQFLIDAMDWEYDFLLASAKEYGIDRVALARFILEYKEKMGRKEKRKRVVKKVLDTATGIIYQSILDFSKQTGIKNSTAYCLIKKNQERFKLLEVV